MVLSGDLDGFWEFLLKQSMGGRAEWGSVWGAWQCLASFPHCSQHPGMGPRCHGNLPWVQGVLLGWLWLGSMAPLVYYKLSCPAFMDLKPMAWDYMSRLCVLLHYSTIVILKGKCVSKEGMFIVETSPPRGVCEMCFYQCNPLQSYTSLSCLKSMGFNWRNYTEDCTASVQHILHS